ncbi:MAG: oligopeptidase A, partial [Cellvibrionales bacterium]|nr:oligopeptidase A [Cellvibrionales bacterium]
MSQSSNPLLQNHELPPFDQIQAHHIVPAIEAILEDNQKIVASILKANKFTYAALAQPLEEISDRLSKAWSPVNHMNSVVSNDELREAVNACLPKISEYETALGQNQALYQAFETLANSDEFTTLSMAQKKSINNSLRDFRLFGVALADDKKSQF